MKTVIILNPRSRTGSDPRIEPILRTRFPAPEARLFRTEFSGQATQIASQAVLKGAETIVAVGGDGTIHEVVNGIIGSPARLGIIPAGTANDLASYFGLPGDAATACDVIQSGTPHPTDVIEVNGRYFITAGGLGFPSKVAGIASLIKRWNTFGPFLARILAGRLYVAAAVWASLVREKHTVIRVRSRGKDLTEDIMCLTVSNQPFLGRKFLVSPGAANDDGRADICLIPNAKTAAGTLAVVLKVMAGRHVDSPAVRTWRIDRMEIETDRPLNFLGDGELDLRATKFSVRVHPRAVNVIVPARASR